MNYIRIKMNKGEVNNGIIKAAIKIYSVSNGLCTISKRQIETSHEQQYVHTIIPLNKRI